jgi:phage terminase large subunit GpA-like protein
MGARDQLIDRIKGLQPAADVVADLMRAIAPAPRMGVSQWADAYRRLPTKGAAEPGQWRTSRVPYLRGIMDALSPEHPAQEVVFCKSVQAAGTECGNNWVGWFLDTQKAPMMVVQPTLDMAERWSKQRLASMIEDCPTLRSKVRPARERDSGNTTLLKEFPGGVLVAAGANSAAGLRSMPVRYLMLDEVDAYPVELEGEGSPIELAEARTTTFSRRKVFKISTPTIESLSVITKAYAASNQQRYHVPCPHCGHSQPLVWENLHWPDGKPAEARYTCSDCGVLIDDHHKTAMLEAGEWVEHNPGHPVAGFHVNALYTPTGLGLSWGELAEKYERARADPVKMKAFENLRLGLATKDPNEKLDFEEIAERADLTRLLRIIPRGCLLLTAGIDVQKDRWAVVILGWGRNGRVWVIDAFELPGDPTRPGDWLKLEAKVAEPIANAYGIPMRVELAAVDSGYLQDDVLAFTRPRQRRGWFAVKGALDGRRPIISRPSKVDFSWKGKVQKRGAEQWHVGGFHSKEWVFSRLSADRERLPEDRIFCFPSGLGEDWYQQLTAEIYDSTKRRFVKIRQRNEALDTVCYALAAAMHPALRVHTWHDLRWNERERVYEPREGDLFSMTAGPEYTKIQADAQPHPSAEKETPEAPAPEVEDESQTEPPAIVPAGYAPAPPRKRQLVRRLNSPTTWG